MAVGLETRVPLLDHRVVEWAWAQPKTLKIKNKTGKWALRQILYTHVPQELIDRPKAGFSLPLGVWLRGPLRDWAEHLLSPVTLKILSILLPSANYGITISKAAPITGRTLGNPDVRELATGIAAWAIQKHFI